MTRHSYVNQIQEAEVGLAIERLLVAEFPANFTPSKIDLDSLPTGFYDLGSVVEDTPSMKATRNLFQLKAGIPQVTVYTAVEGMEASLALSLNSNSWRKVQYAFANITYTCSATTLSATPISSVVNLNSFQTTVASFVKCKTYITLGSGGTFDDADSVEIRVTNVSTTTSGYYLVGHTTPQRLLTTADIIGTYSFVTQFVGTRQIRYFTLLGVADFVDGVQVVHEFPRVTPMGEFEDAFRPNQSARMPLNFTAYGVPTTVNACSELVVCKRHYFPSSSCC